MTLFITLAAVYLFAGFVYAIYCCFDSGQFDVDIGGGWVPWWYAWPLAIICWPIFLREVLRK